jgi:hypothetical protein
MLGKAPGVVSAALGAASLGMGRDLLPGFTVVSLLFLSRLCLVWI